MNQPRAPYKTSDIVNLESWIPDGDYNPHNIRPWQIGGEFGTLAICFASCESEAFDEAIDADKLDSYMVDGGYCEQYANEHGCEHLTGGGASQCFDQTYLWCDELPNSLHITFGDAQ